MSENRSWDQIVTKLQSRLGRIANGLITFGCSLVLDPLNWAVYYISEMEFFIYVLEDVLGLEDVLEDTFWSPWPWPRRSSPWPWPRSFKSSKTGLSSARGQHYFLNSWISLENARNFAENLRAPFGFPHLEHRRGQGEGDRGSAPSPIEISPMTKMWQKSL